MKNAKKIIFMCLICLVSLSFSEGNRSTDTLEFINILQMVRQKGISFAYQKAKRQRKFAENRLQAWPEDPEVSLFAKPIGDGRKFDENGEIEVVFTTKIPFPWHLMSLHRWRKLSDKSTELSYESAILKEYLEVYLVFNQALFSQERVALLYRQISNARKLHKNAKIKVMTGDASPLDSLRTFLSLASIIVDSSSQAVELMNAYQRIGMLWGDDSQKISCVVGRPYEVDSLPRWSQVRESVNRTPNLEGKRILAQIKRIETRLEILNFFSRLEVSGGLSSNRTTDEKDWFAELSLKIPLFGKQIARVNASKKSSRELELLYHNLEILQLQKASLLYSNLQSVTLRIGGIKDDQMPSAQKSFELAEQGYRAGRFSSIEVLDAQRKLIELQENLLIEFEKYRMTIMEFYLTTGIPTGVLSEVKKVDN